MIFKSLSTSNNIVIAAASWSVGMATKEFITALLSEIVFPPRKKNKKEDSSNIFIESWCILLDVFHMAHDHIANFRDLGIFSQ